MKAWGSGMGRSTKDEVAVGLLISLLIEQNILMGAEQGQKGHIAAGRGKREDCGHAKRFGALIWTLHSYPGSLSPRELQPQLLEFACVSDRGDCFSRAGLGFHGAPATRGWWMAEFTFLINISLPLPSLFPDIYCFPS